MTKYILFFFCCCISLSSLAQDDDANDVKGFEVKKKVRVNTDGENGMNEDITLVVLDKKKLEDFIATYSPLDYKNSKIKTELRNLYNSKYSEFKFPMKNELFNNRCTVVPNEKDFEIAKVVLQSALDSNSKFVKNNFGGAINYLFFYKCLPDELQSKWFQELFGNYHFNANMMELLRENSFYFDELVSGANQKDLTDVDPIFGGHNFNEIELKEAANMKQILSTRKEFKDNSMIESKKIMFEILNRIISNEWRVFIVEWE